MDNKKFAIFLVEDDPWYGQSLSYHLGLNPEFEITLFTSGKDLLSNLFKNPHLICIDFGLPDMKGDMLLMEIQQRNRSVPVIVISAQEDINVAVKLLKCGAQDYIIKDEHANDLLWKSVVHIRENLNLRQKVEELSDKLVQKYSFESTIIGQSNAIKKTFHLLNKAIKSNINVSLTGETGTGKEVYAKAIHYNSDRCKKPFVALNMGAIPSELIESELFGHEKGAFTGAITTKKGKFEEANGGTLFLDEIGELDLSLQSKLLRVLQERELVKVGGNKAVKFDIRLIIASHKNLTEEVQKGNFREDLFFRLVGLSIELPPLRDREYDVIILAKYFITEYCKSNNMNVLHLHETAKTKLRKYSWPGNIRELKAVIELACVMSDDDNIKAEDITFFEVGDNKPYSISEFTLKQYENEIITHYLKKYDDNVLLVAKKLDIGKSKIYNMINNGEIKLN
jgi:DNA-binding NtrC family response regulator